MYASATPTRSAAPGWAVTAAVVGGAVVGLLATLAVSPATPPALYRTVAPTPRLTAMVTVPPLATTAQPQSARQASRAASAEGEEGAPEGPARAATATAAGAGLAGAAVGAAVAAALVSRRRAAATLVGLTVAAPLLAGQPAAALLPDDKDYELLGLTQAEVKANRQAQLAREQELNKKFLDTVSVSREYAALQNTIIGLSVVGKRLAAGGIDGDGRKAAAGLPVAALTAEVAAQSPTPEAQQLGDQSLADLAALQAAVAAGGVGPAKAAYLTAVASLKAWCAAAGVADKVNGL